MNKKISSILLIALIVLGAGCVQKISPEEFNRLKEEGIQKAKSGEYSQAVEILKKASNAKPDDIQVYRYLAESYENLKQFDEAVETWHKIIYISPRDSSEAREGLAKLKELESRKKAKQEAYSK